MNEKHKKTTNKSKFFVRAIKAQEQAADKHRSIKQHESTSSTKSTKSQTKSTRKSSKKNHKNKQHRSTSSTKSTRTRAARKAREAQEQAARKAREAQEQAAREARAARKAREARAARKAREARAARKAREAQEQAAREARAARKAREARAARKAREAQEQAARKAREREQIEADNKFAQRLAAQEQAAQEQEQAAQEARAARVRRIQIEQIPQQRLKDYKDHNKTTKKLDDIKNFNNVPADGFCGYWCIYNAIFIPENLRTEARPEFKIGILDEDFKKWLMSTLKIIMDKYNGKDIKEVTGLIKWLNEYNDNIGTEAKAGPLRKYFKKNGNFNDEVYDSTDGFIKTKQKIPEQDFKLLDEYTRQLDEDLWSTDTIIGIIGKINKLNIIIYERRNGYTVSK